jgi:hypothetical protein
MLRRLRLWCLLVSREQSGEGERRGRGRRCGRGVPRDWGAAKKISMGDMFVAEEDCGFVTVTICKMKDWK